ncbi:YjbA family protein [Bacillus massiliglaciei]|uniref:YjbA family protein n=1 Tax=Bacillus massiliglaciei TaxID=1816693 RepID=UPI000A65BF03|nr:YjbA family protein [Bacillus massiliglaciei]
MLYLHDVWVNWFEGEENGYNICHFHEWRKDDGIELLDQVPLLYISAALFHYIENDLSELPKTLLNDVYQKAYARKNHERTQLDYCFVVTDGKGILAVDTIGYHIPIRKSRLIPRQEQIVYDMIENQKEMDFPFTVKSQDEKEYHILSPSPLFMNGLTRKERQLKQLLFMAMDQLFTAKNTAEIRYWYTEWSPEKYRAIQQMDFEPAWRELYEALKEGWSEKHLQLCGNLVKGQPFFEKLWEMEIGDSPSML